MMSSTDSFRLCPNFTLAALGRSLSIDIHARVGPENPFMKPHLSAGDTSDDRKAMQEELTEAKAKLCTLIEAEGDEILKKPIIELRTSVPALQGGRPESKRRKF